MIHDVTQLPEARESPRQQKCGNDKEMKGILHNNVKSMSTESSLKAEEQSSVR